jgi:Uma2 family endonuclease
MTLATAPPASPPARFTPDDLLNLPDAVNYELVDGQLVERHMGMESSLVAAIVIGEIRQFLKQQPIGLVFGADASYRCYPDAPDKVRKPDVSFIRNGRLPGDRVPKGHCPIAPDLAVEVVSPNDLAYELDEKVAEYQAAGVPLVWVVNPAIRRVRIHRPATAPLGSIAELTANDVITGEDVLPGFRCPVREFFGST